MKLTVERYPNARYEKEILARILLKLGRYDSGGESADGVIPPIRPILPAH